MCPLYVPTTTTNSHRSLFGRKAPDVMLLFLLLFAITCSTAGAVPAPLNDVSTPGSELAASHLRYPSTARVTRIGDLSETHAHHMRSGTDTATGLSLDNRFAAWKHGPDEGMAVSPSMVLPRFASSLLPSHTSSLPSSRQRTPERAVLEWVAKDSSVLQAASPQRRKPRRVRRGAVKRSSLNVVGARSRGK